MAEGENLFSIIGFERILMRKRMLNMDAELRANMANSNVSLKLLLFGEGLPELTKCLVLSLVGSSWSSRSLLFSTILLRLDISAPSSGLFFIAVANIGRFILMLLCGLVNFVWNLYLVCQPWLFCRFVSVIDISRSAKRLRAI